VTAHAPAQEIVIHATCVALEGRAALIRGAAGQGKSGLALQLIALGATLVADDRTRLWRNDDRLIADAPDTIRGRIEARGLGILHLPQTGPAPVACVVDLDRSETDRLPSLCHETVMDLRLPSFGKSPHPHFPAVILLYLRYGTIS
jgi:HPr kinase/phosphorylase